MPSACLASHRKQCQRTLYASRDNLESDLTVCSHIQYSMWLDQHSMEEALRFIRSALEACAPAAEKEPGFSDVYPFMLQISKGNAQ